MFHGAQHRSSVGSMKGFYAVSSTDLSRFLVYLLTKTLNSSVLVPLNHSSMELIFTLHVVSASSREHASSELLFSLPSIILFRLAAFTGNGSPVYCSPTFQGSAVPTECEFCSKGSLVPLHNKRAGVSGLTTALLLAKKGVHDIQIVAKHMPGDYDVEYASPWAGANFAPVKRPAAAPKSREVATRIAGYEEASWPEFAKLAEKRPEAGVAFQRVAFRILRRAEDTDNTWLDDLLLAKPEPWFKDPLQLRQLSSTELPPNIDLGVELRSVCINTALYLPWLVSQCVLRGVTLDRGDVSHVAEAAGQYPATDVIVNCTGLSARCLGGVEDHSLYPARGQIALVRRAVTAAPATMYSLSGTDDADDETCYTMHRPGGGGTVLGGCLQRDSWDGKPDLALGARIIRRAVALDPGLLNGQQGVSVIRHGVGLRPMRDAGPRIEMEEVSWQGNRVVIAHNYGHGGYGYQMSYGCAQEVVRLIAG
nr:d-amino-acid oxidase [Quercus suber]